MRRILYIVIIFQSLVSESVAAAYPYEYNDRCREAYQQYMALHLDEGKKAVTEEIFSGGNNMMATFVADYEDCLLLLFNGNKNDYEQRRSHMDERIRLLDKGDASSPWHRLCKAGIYLHWALVNIRMGDNYRAAINFRKSFVLLKENRKKFPNFEYNDIYWGLEVAAVGAIPENYKWILAIFGMNGDVKQGVGYIDRFIDKHSKSDFLYDEAVVLSCYLRFYLLYQQDKVWNFVNSSEFQPANNLLQAFVKANIAVNYRHADVCLATLRLAQKDKSYDRYPIFDYEYASALFLKLNMNSIDYFKRFLSRYRGSLFVKETWQKIAYAYYLKGNMSEASANRQKIKSAGSTVVDADKQAERFAQEKDWPDRTLLEAHLLIDGGFYRNALDRLQKKSAGDFVNTADRIEYYFRLARVYDELNNDTEAITNYQKVISLGKNRKEHFAARSALQIAFIYEKRGKKQDAISKYNECLTMRDHDFQNSIDQQAKAGINRLQQ